MEIETGVKISVYTKYPKCEDMEVGNSFFVEGGSSEDRVRAINSMTKKSASKNLGHKYASRKVEGGYRIWRVK